MWLFGDWAFRDNEGKLKLSAGRWKAETRKQAAAAPKTPVRTQRGDGGDQPATAQDFQAGPRPAATHSGHCATLDASLTEPQPLRTITVLLGAGRLQDQHPLVASATTLSVKLLLRPSPMAHCRCAGRSSCRTRVGRGGRKGHRAFPEHHCVFCAVLACLWHPLCHQEPWVTIRC